MRDVGDITPLGKVMWWIGAVRFYATEEHGKTRVQGEVWRWWHPACWIMWVVVLQICGWVGEPIREVVRWRLPRWYKDHPDIWRWL